MANRRDDWDESHTSYSTEQIESVLDGIEVEYDYETSNDFVCYCPYHSNTDTPSMSVSRTTGQFICFSPGCNESGTLVDLVRFQRHCDHLVAARFIIKAGHEKPQDLKVKLQERLTPTPVFVPFDQGTLDKLEDFFWLDDRAKGYMEGRGFADETMKHFHIGYSARRDLITVPMHDPTGIPVGLIGRSIDGKIFKNSKNLPRSKTTWNFHRAKRAADSVIIVESSFDAMRCYQAGYENVVAVLGGYVSEEHIRQISRTFNSVVIATDMDTKKFNEPCNICKKQNLNLCRGHNPGRKLGENIAERLNGKRITWATFDYKVVYPHGAKDLGDLTDSEIRQCIRNATGHGEYMRWKIW